MLTHLSPARRRFVVGVVLLALALVVTAVVAALMVRREPDVRPVGQETLGPVLLVPGYGGSTTSLQVLADALAEGGRDVSLVDLGGDGTGDLREQAQALDAAVEAALDRTGAPSVDVVGYSAGGVVARLWVAELGGGSLARRVVTLASPHHGSELAALAGGLATDACPEACQQLAPDSDLLRELNGEDETPAGPLWVAIWTEDDATVVPPSSGSLEGAVAFAVQEVCPDEIVAHPDVPRTASVIAMVAAQLGVARPAVPDGAVCTGTISP